MGKGDTRRVGGVHLVVLNCNWQLLVVISMSILGKPAHRVLSNGFLCRQTSVVWFMGGSSVSVHSTTLDHQREIGSNFLRLVYILALAFGAEKSVNLSQRCCRPRLSQKQTVKILCVIHVQIQSTTNTQLPYHFHYL